MPTHNIAVLVGSLRKQSFSRKLALNLAKLAPASLKLGILEIGNLPLYNQDDDASPPAASAAFKQAVKAASGVIFVTPEYNRSVPGVLKNAIDIASRPYGQSAWSGKPAAVVSCSPGNIGGYGANHHLRQSLVFLDMPAMAQPEAYFSGVDKWFDEQGGLTDKAPKDVLQKFIDAYAKWVDTHAG